MKILFTSPGKRVELIEIFKRVFPNAKLYGGDYDETSPANYFLNKVFKLPYRIDDNYVAKALEICQEEKVNILIPLIDPELIVFASHRQPFFNIKTFVMISSSRVVKICMNKWKMYQFFRKHKIPCPRTWFGASFRREDFKGPVILKPYAGSASKGVYVCKIPEDLERCKDLLNNNYLVQEFIKGYEVTVDVFVTKNGRCIEAVQRKRLKVRGGEVERGVTQKDSYIFEMVKKVVGALKPVGVINIQFIVDFKKRAYYVTEINPRFGGGYPLAHAAGANFPLLLYRLAKGDNLLPILGSYKDQFYMLRYDKAIYTDRLVNLC